MALSPADRSRVRALALCLHRASAAGDTPVLPWLPSPVLRGVACHFPSRLTGRPAVGSTVFLLDDPETLLQRLHTRGKAEASVSAFAGEPCTVTTEAGDHTFRVESVARDFWLPPTAFQYAPLAVGTPVQVSKLEFPLVPQLLHRDCSVYARTFSNERSIGPLMGAAGHIAKVVAEDLYRVSFGPGRAELVVPVWLLDAHQSAECVSY